MEKPVNEADRVRLGLTKPDDPATKAAAGPSNLYQQQAKEGFYAYWKKDK
ncbi:hypothetical protein NST84_05550 [Paenibacillus sp. FSL R7-0345]